MKLRLFILFFIFIILSFHNCSVVDTPSEFTYVEPAQSVTFSDFDMDIGQIGGLATIERASDEYNVDYYCVYLGTVENDKSILLGEIPQTGGDMVFYIPHNTFIGNYTRIVVYTRNEENVSTISVETPIEDRQGDPPANYAQSVTFTDEDSDPWEIGGTITIQRAIDESDVTIYCLYYITNNNSFIKYIELAKTGANIEYTIQNNTLLGNNKYFFVTTKNGIDETMDGPACLIYDNISDKLKLVADINLNGHSSPRYLTVFNNSLYFSANNGFNGYELWCYDDNQYFQISDIKGTDSSSPESLISYNNKLYFTAEDNNYGFEMRVYDGTNEPIMVADINIGSDGSRPGDFTIFNSNLYFIATDGANGCEIWKYNGINNPSIVTDLSYIPY